MWRNFIQFVIIEKDSEIKGWEIANKEIKQSFFADDSTFVNDRSLKSVERLVYVKYSKISGLNLYLKILQYYELGR